MAIVGYPQHGIPRSDRLTRSQGGRLEGRPLCIDACSFCTLRSAIMRAMKLTIAIFLLWSALSSTAVRAENGSPANSDNGRAEQEITPSVNISSEAVRSYINWIAQQTGWHAANVPPIKITSFAHLRELSGLSSEAEWMRPAAFYSKGEHVIYLADSWNKDDLVDQSILVHELVHHLQIENQIRFACWGRYEAQAYELQIKWLSTQGVKDPHKLLHASQTSIETLAECS